MGLGKFESHSSGLGNVERIERREFVRIDIPPDFFLVFFFINGRGDGEDFGFFRLLFLFSRGRLFESSAELDP